MLQSLMMIHQLHLQLLSGLMVNCWNDSVINIVNFKVHQNVEYLIVFVLVGKDFLGQVIKVEFAEKRVPKGGFGGRGGGRGAVVFQH